MNLTFYHQNRFNIFVGFPLLLLNIFIFPCYLSEEVLHTNTSSTNLQPTTDMQPTFRSEASENIEEAQNSNDLNIGIIFVIFSILSLLTSTILLTFIWNYLKNAAITKECILLYLYEDSVGIVLIGSWVWFAIVISGYTTTTGATLGVYQVTILSFCIITIELQLLLILNVVSIIKLYTIKEMVLDPPIPWGDDDHDCIKILRIVSWMVITLFVVCMYAGGFYPKGYYYLIGDSRSLLELPNGPVIFDGILGVLFVIPTISTIPASFYRQSEEQSLATQRNQRFHHQLIIFILIIAAGIVYGIFSSSLGSFLIFGQLLIVGGCVLTPFLIIITSVPLKAYTEKILANALANAMEYVLIVWNYNFRVIDMSWIFQQRHRQIHPII